MPGRRRDADAAICIHIAKAMAAHIPQSHGSKDEVLFGSFSRIEVPGEFLFVHVRVCHRHRAIRVVLDGQSHNELAPAKAPCVRRTQAGLLFAALV